VKFLTVSQLNWVCASHCLRAQLSIGTRDLVGESTLRMSELVDATSMGCRLTVNDGLGVLLVIDSIVRVQFFHSFYLLLLLLKKR